MATAGLLITVLVLSATDAAGWAFLGLVAFFTAWGGQAILAYRRAVELGGRPGGAEAMLALAPVAVVVFTAFWLVAGSLGSPAATLQRYVSAWRSDRPDLAATLFDAPREPAALAEQWSSDEGYLRGRLLELAASLEPGSGLDPERPFAPLVVRFPDSVGPAGEPAAIEAGEEARAVIEIVRRESVRGSFFGLVPTASQRIVTVEQVGQARLVAAAGPGLAPLPEALVWRLESVCFGSAPCQP
jgi:hypothetical protein